MKKIINSISISYPPLTSKKGKAFLSQNRQFQWTNTGNLIFPVIPAYAATLLKHNSLNVFWDDAIAQNLSYKSWQERLIKTKPDLIVIETKTPVIKKHWKIIKQIKLLYNPVIVLMGDHVTALPQESLKNCPVDYVLTGGDYDFMLLNLVNHLNKKEKLEAGFWYRTKNNQIKNSGKFALKHHNLDQLPIIDRDLTQCHLYAYNNTNYKYKPGAYIMSARDCWWGKCEFCSWTTLYPHTSFRSFSVNHTINEIENLVNNYKVKEIFDDSGTFPVGKWLDNFCHEMINRGLNKKVKISCNMRFNALTQEQYSLMAKAGFRFILYGFESANQNTLDRINKNLKINQIRPTLVMAKKAKLHPHITIMIGYPWETKIQAQKTLNFARKIFKDGLADSMQATLVIPYPGTPLFAKCQKNNLLITENWDDYDMRQPVIKSLINSNDQKNMVRNLFKGILTPKFLINQITSIRSFNDLKHLFNYSIKYLKKLKDFSMNENH